MLDIEIYMLDIEIYKEYFSFKALPQVNNYVDTISVK